MLGVYSNRDFLEVTRAVSYSDDLTAYETVKSNALDWILANTAQTFNWQGEFQDVAPNAPYENMCHCAQHAAKVLYDSLGRY